MPGTAIQNPRGEHVIADREQQSSYHARNKGAERGSAPWLLFIDADVWEDRGELFAVIALIVGFGSGAGYCFAEYFLTRGGYNDERIEFYTPWTGRKTERWSDLVGVELNAQMSWFVLTFRSGTKIRISTMLSGHGGMLAVLEQKGLPLHL